MRRPSLSTLSVISREHSIVRARLHCGFCNAYDDGIHWYAPSDMEQDLSRMVIEQHFRDCPARGDAYSIELTLFDGKERKRLRILVHQHDETI